MTDDAPHRDENNELIDIYGDPVEDTDDVWAVKEQIREREDDIRGR